MLLRLEGSEAKFYPSNEVFEEEKERERESFRRRLIARFEILRSSGILARIIPRLAFLLRISRRKKEREKEKNHNFLRNRTPLNDIPRFNRRVGY